MTTQPIMANASLYSGQPTDTGSSCPSASLVSCTPSIPDNASNGVSVENVTRIAEQQRIMEEPFDGYLVATVDIIYRKS